MFGNNIKLYFDEGHINNAVKIVDMFPCINNIQIFCKIMNLCIH